MRSPGKTEKVGDKMTHYFLGKRRGGMWKAVATKERGKRGERGAGRERQCPLVRTNGEAWGRPTSAGLVLRVMPRALTRARPLMFLMSPE